MYDDLSFNILATCHYTRYIGLYDTVIRNTHCIMQAISTIVA